MTLRIGSLFSGAGGLDMAVAEVFGGDIAWHSEIDKAACKVLAYRFPGVLNLGSVTEIDWASVEPVDVLCGGFPCQDVSAAGKRAGIKDGTRSGLWAIFADAIDALRPQVVVIENVRGLLSATAHRNVEPDSGTMGDRASGPVLRAAGAVLGDLADLGYDAAWATVSAASVGAPHRRERVFIVATADADSRGFQVCTQRDGEPQKPRLKAPQRRDVDRCHCNAADSSSNGWNEGRPEPARVVGGFDAAVSGDAAGRVAMLPTPRATDGTDGPVTNCPSVQAICDGSAGRSPRLSEMAAGGLLGGDATGRVELLPTPTAQAARHGGESRFGGGNGDVSNLWKIAHLLPTPRSSDCFGAGQHGEGGLDLRTTVTQLAKENHAATEGRLGEGLRDMRDTADPQAVCVGPTGGPQRVPEADPLLPGVCQQQDGGASGQSPLAGAADQAEGILRGLRHNGEAAHPSQGQEPGEQRFVKSGCAVQQLPQEAALAGGPRGNGQPDTGSRWGRYEAAIRRWEAVLGRPAPDPTEPNKNGNPRLAAEFSSWLMGWPAGWVTDPDIGISRNDQLRIVGNGVCSQQAEAALRFLLGVTTDTHTHTHLERADVNVLLPTPRASDPSNATSHSSPGFRPQLGEVVRRLAPNKSTAAE